MSTNPPASSTLDIGGSLDALRALLRVAQAPEVAPVVQPAVAPPVPTASSGGGFDLGALLGLLQNPLVLSLVGGLIALITKKKGAAPAPVVQPAPTPVTPPVTTAPPVPVGTPPAPVPAITRRVAKLVAHILGIEGWNGKVNGHALLGAAVVRDIISGAAFCGAGYRIHYDVTPFDSAGNPFYHPDLATYASLFFITPAAGEVEGNNRVLHYIRIDGKEYGPQGDLVTGEPFQQQEVVDLTSEYDEGGFTPVLTVPQDIELSVDHTVEYRAVFVNPDGQQVDSGWTPAVHVKAWGF